MKISYTRAQVSDWETVHSLFLEAISFADGTYHADTEKDAVIHFIKTVQVFLLIDDSVPVGMISYSETEPGCFYVEELVIGHNIKGKGYGNEALSWLLDKLKLAKSVSLVTHPHNTPAIRLYLKHGFRIEEWKDNFYGDGTPRIRMMRTKNKE